MIDRPRSRRLIIGTLLAIASMHVAGAASMPGTAPASEDSPRERRCLAITIYHEARGEPREGQIAVAHVIVNRRGKEEFPSTICGVVKQGATSGGSDCQFSIWCDGQAEVQSDEELRDSDDIARAVLAGEEPDPTGGAQWFHAVDARPSWARRLVPTIRIGRHQFLKAKEHRAAD